MRNLIYYYDNYRVTRQKGKVIFGCGSVTIPKELLHQVADLLENEDVINYRSQLTIIKNNLQFSNPKDFKRLKEFITLSNKLKKEIAIFEELRVHVRTFKTLHQLLYIVPSVYRRLAGRR